MTRTARLSAARGWLHDQLCMSDDCTGDNEHARRTQHPAARAFVDAPDELSRLRALHPTFCLAAARGACARTDEHHARLAQVALPALTERGAA